MFWFFEKDGESLQCEIRPSSNAAGFELEVTASDGQKRLDHADDANVLALRLMELEQQLKREGWRQSDEHLPQRSNALSRVLRPLRPPRPCRS